MQVAQRGKTARRGVGFPDGVKVIQYHRKLPFDVQRPQLLDHVAHLPVPGRVRGAKDAENFWSAR